MRGARGLLLPIFVLSALGCGKRGDPRPPLRKTPQPIAQFRVAQRGARLEISGVAPRASSEGVALRSMTIELLRADVEGDFLKLAKKRSFTVQAGETFTEPETLPTAGTLVRVAARAVASGKASPLTGISALPAQAPPAAPSNLEAALVEGGVRVKWSGRRPTPLPLPAPAPPTANPPAASGAPPASAPPVPPAAETAPASRAGFWLYRRPQAGTYAAPLFPEPTSDKSYLDAEAAAGLDWCYVARAVVSTEPLIESDSSNEACLTAQDVAPPSVPGGLTLLAVPGGLELRWSPAPESDLLLYRVYRAAANGAPEKIAETPAGTTVYVDRGARPGSAYRYTVTAVDRAQNESAPSAPLLGNAP